MRRTVRQMARCVILGVAPLLAGSGAAAAAPRVAVTVKPLHSLIAGVMSGVGEPGLIISGAGSPHTYGLKPSEARLLENAEVIFWVGESLETFMEKPLSALGSRARIVQVARARGIALLPSRAGGFWEEHGASGSDGHGHGGGGVPAAGAERETPSWDGHLWLDPRNARAIVRLAADTLGDADPGNRGRYRVNEQALIARIDAVDAELESLLAPLRDVPFVVFHDAYRYFENRYGLRSVGSIAVSPERRPGARRVKEVREKIRGLGARCVFSEPQFSPAILGTLIEGTSARTAPLDPLGVDLAAGPEAWFSLMRNLGSALSTCLR